MSAGAGAMPLFMMAGQDDRPPEYLPARTRMPGLTPDEVAQYESLMAGERPWYEEWLDPTQFAGPGATMGALKVLKKLGRGMRSSPAAHWWFGAAGAAPVGLEAYDPFAAERTEQHYQKLNRAREMERVDPRIRRVGTTVKG